MDEKVPFQFDPKLLYERLAALPPGSPLPPPPFIPIPTLAEKKSSPRWLPLVIIGLVTLIGLESIRRALDYALEWDAGVRLLDHWRGAKQEQAAKDLAWRLATAEWAHSALDEVVPEESPVQDDGTGAVKASPKGKKIVPAAATAAPVVFEVSSVPSVRHNNVNPSPHFAPKAASKRKVKYLSYEPHSGFHNQRIALANAIVMARLLDRTLLLPPARLGRPEAWGPTLSARLALDEDCKFPSPSSPPCTDPAPTEWTYVSWSYLMRPGLFAQVPYVDRWNSSAAWIAAPPSVVLSDTAGLNISESETHAFPDQSRRSYKIFEEKKTPGTMGKFDFRLNLDELKAGKLGKTKLLSFGSLFGEGRLVLGSNEAKAMRKEVQDAMVLGHEGIWGVGETMRKELGRYVGVHARVGDGVFKTNARTNMLELVRTLSDHVGLSPAAVMELMAHLASSPSHPLLLPSASTAPTVAPHAQGNRAHHRRPLRRNIPTGPPIAASKTCLGILHIETPHLPLNTPIFLATDSVAPRDDPALAPIFRVFPCTFVLGDFEAATGMEGEEWTSGWDGMGLKGFLVPFLDAEMAARGSKTFGTPGSTFSAYTTGVLHAQFLENAEEDEEQM